MLLSIRPDHPDIHKYQRYSQIVNRWLDYWLRRPVELVKSLHSSDEAYYAFEEFIYYTVSSLDKVNAYNIIDSLSKSDVQMCESGEVMPKGIDLPVSDYFGKKYVSSENNCQNKDQKNNLPKGKYIQLSQIDLIHLMAMFQSGIQLWDLERILGFVQKMNKIDEKPKLSDQEKIIAQFSHIERNLERLKNQRTLTAIESRLMNELVIFSNSYQSKKEGLFEKINTQSNTEKSNQSSFVAKCKMQIGGIRCQ